MANQGSKLENPDFVLFLAAQNLPFSRFCEANMLTHTLRSDKHDVNRQGMLRETRQLYRTRGRGVTILKSAQRAQSLLARQA
jgi:hypothetical protein